ncbi:MAG: phosphatase PAP2 family protein [Candidatus Poseidoniaceae archaeon]
MSEPRHGRRLLVHLFQLGVIALGSYVLANLWNAANATKDHAIALPIDAHVPLLPWTTVIYLGFFLLYIVPARMAYGNQARMDELDRIVPMMVAWTVLHSVFFVLVPAEVPRSVTPSDAWLLEAIRDSDHPWNAWPSLHVVHVILLAGLVDRWTAIEDRAARRPVLALVVALVVLSTFTTEQHYVWDAISGAITGSVGWWLITKRMEHHQPKTADTAD